MSSVYLEFEKTCTEAAEKPFLHIPAVAASSYSSTAIDLSYGEALQQVKECAQQYQRQGYGSPMRVALLLENRPEFFIHWFALNSIGCSVLPVSREMQVEETAYFLEHGEVVLVTAVTEAMDQVEKASRLLDKAPAIVDCYTFSELPPASQQRDNLAPDEQTECALLYTSGSTGKPKGCILNNEYFLVCGNWYNNLGGLTAIRWGQERLLTPLPLGHMNAMAVSGMAMIMSAGCIVQLDRFHPRSWWQTVRESGATIVHYLGVLPAILLELPASSDDDVSQQVRFGFGAGVNPRHHAIFEQRFGFALVEAWAMTESGSGGCIIANREPRHVGSCCFGVPAETVEFQLVDEQKQVVPSGQDGELRVRAAGANPRRGFFSGYLKNPAATEEAWQDGWLNTGDVVREGEDGSLHFVDRRKNVIRRSGENISALEVEAVLSLDPTISEGLVTAVTDDLRGDEVAACIIPAAGAAASEQLAAAIVERCLQHLAYYKVPAYVTFCTELPRTASNKPRRAEVKALAGQSVANGDCFDLRHMKKRHRGS